jgi:hypothetical protein
VRQSRNTILNPLTVFLLVACLLLTIIVCFLLVMMKSSPKAEPHESQLISSQKTQTHKNQQRSSSMAGISRDNPIPLGVRAIMSDGIEMTVLSFDRDIWPKVRASNSFNTPPAQNKRMLMIRIRVKNVASPEEPVRWAYPSEIALIGSYNTVWKVPGSSCGAVFPDHFGEVELYKNGEKEGNVCFQVPNDETNLLLRYDENKTLSTRYYRYFVVEK